MSEICSPGFIKWLQPKGKMRKRFLKAVTNQVNWLFIKWFSFYFIWKRFIYFIFIDVGELVKGALSNITEGVCRPLRLRLEQVISPDIGPAVLHTLSGLIRFYLNTIGEVCIFFLWQTNFKSHNLIIHWNFRLYRTVRWLKLLMTYLINVTTRFWLP